MIASGKANTDKLKDHILSKVRRWLRDQLSSLMKNSRQCSRCRATSESFVRVLEKPGSFVPLPLPPSFPFQCWGWGWRQSYACWAGALPLDYTPAPARLLACNAIDWHKANKLCSASRGSKLADHEGRVVAWSPWFVREEPVSKYAGFYRPCDSCYGRSPAVPLNIKVTTETIWRDT